jgi:hypothetical protein
VPSADRPSHLWFKAGLFTLLACNAAAYVASGTLFEALDSLAWLGLLLLFELETGFGWGARGGWTARAIRGARLLAATAVAAAAAGYVREREWLDAINAWLWIATVIVLESQIRVSALAARLRATLAVAAAMLFVGLAAVAVAWMWEDEWFDAYDALLWLAALVVIEMNILRRLARSRRRQTP